MLPEPVQREPDAEYVVAPAIRLRVAGAHEADDGAAARRRCCSGCRREPGCSRPLAGHQARWIPGRRRTPRPRRGRSTDGFSAGSGAPRERPQAGLSCARPVPFARALPAMASGQKVGTLTPRVSCHPPGVDRTDRQTSQEVADEVATSTDAAREPAGRATEVTPGPLGARAVTRRCQRRTPTCTGRRAPPMRRSGSRPPAGAAGCGVKRSRMRRAPNYQRTSGRCSCPRAPAEISLPFGTYADRDAQSPGPWQFLG